ncbi:hypothetical protein KEJ21_00305 [Candidatus Bathyarchaeota archaeon]|nr:hypothetical protein [Candidatus Bathyarchaeota archaeon]MBS7630002.1 hypothetical protein [Candidatus Bathyarchaeota archaeon]
MDREPCFLSNPVILPKDRPKKSSEPIICFLGQIRQKKRPEPFIELAKRFPEIKFVFIGAAMTRGGDVYLRKN